MTLVQTGQSIPHSRFDSLDEDEEREGQSDRDGEEEGAEDEAGGELSPEPRAGQRLSSLFPVFSEEEEEKGLDPSLLLSPGRMNSSSSSNSRVGSSARPSRRASGAHLTGTPITRQLSWRAAHTPDDMHDHELGLALGPDTHASVSPASPALSSASSPLEAPMTPVTPAGAGDQTFLTADGSICSEPDDSDTPSWISPLIATTSSDFNRI